MFNSIGEENLFVFPWRNCESLGSVFLFFSLMLKPKTDSESSEGAERTMMFRMFPFFSSFFHFLTCSTVVALWREIKPRHTSEAPRF